MNTDGAKSAWKECDGRRVILTKTAVGTNGYCVQECVGIQW